MEATRPLAASSRRRGKLPAFYQPPASSTSAAQIIAEARQSLKLLPTERPLTPADANRKLFGKKRSTSRPPSVFSIGAQHFSDSRPTTAQRLEPIESILASQQTEVDLSKPTPPTPVQSACHLIPQSRSLTAAEWNEYSSNVPIPHAPDSSPGSSSRRVTSADHVTRVRHISEERDQCREDGREEGSDRESCGQRRSSVPLHTPGTHPLRPPSKGGRVEGKKRKSEIPPFWHTEISPLLSKLSPQPTSPLDPEAMREVVDQLHKQLRERQCCGRTGGVVGVKQRSAVLRVVFSLLDSPDPSLLVKLASVIMAMEVTGSNLLNVCKLLFSLARTDSNDHLFTEEAIAAPLLTTLSRCDAASDSDVLVYGVGTVKLLASNSDLRVQLVECDVMSVLSCLLERYSQRTTADSDQLTGIQNVLVQLTAALRNLSEHTPLRASFLSSSLLPHLATTLSSHLSHPDITFNITRLLSKLTLHRDCCLAVLQCPPFLPLLLQSLTLHHTHPDILVRVCFILGNLTTEDEDARQELCSTHHALLPLTSLITSTIDTELTKENERHADHEKDNNEELLIKLVRLLANLSVDNSVGRLVASDKAIVDQLITILRSLPLSSYRELTVNTLATLNNLSYHAPPDSYLVHQQKELSQLLVRVLLEDDGEPLLECVRCYGNLSRHQSVCQTVSENKVDELLITLLDSSRCDLVYASCGVLVNLLADTAHRHTLTACGGVSKLIDVLRDFGSRDWQLAGLVCQALWNFSEGMTSSSSCFGEKEVERLLDLLHAYSEMPESLEEDWREYFVPMGTSLLDRVLSHHTDLVPLD